MGDVDGNGGLADPGGAIDRGNNHPAFWAPVLAVSQQRPQSREFGLTVGEARHIMR